MKTTMASTLHTVSRTFAMTTTSPAPNTTAFDNTTTASFVSEEERLRYLQHLQDDTTITMIPVLILLVILSVVGLIGNSMVLFVYSRRFKRTSTRVLIMAIAVFDLIANVVGIPGEIYDMFHIWDFDNPPLCRARLFVNAFSVLSSALVLLAVAVVRYRKVCAPYRWQVTIRQAKIISIVVTCLGVLFALPIAIIAGKQTRETPRPDIYGYECTTDDQYVDTIWPVLTNAFFLFLFVVCCVPFTVLYALIGIKAWKHSKIYGNSASAFSTKSTNVSNSSTTEQPRKKSKKRSTKSKIKKTKSKESIDGSVGLGSIADIMEQFKHDDMKPETADQYTVRIFNDTVEIRTPMMGEFIVELKNASDNAGFVHDYEVFEYKGESNDTKSDVGESNRNVEYENVGHNEMEASNSADNVANSSSERNKDHSAYSNEISHDIKTTDQAVNNDLEHNSVHDCDSIENDAPVTMVTNHYVNDSVTVAPTSRRESLVADHTDKDTEEDDRSETRSDFQDPVAALKWVDIIYCPEEDHSQDKTRDSKYDGVNKTKCSKPFSLRIPANNIVVQKTEWLRNVLADAVNKTKTKKKPEEPTEQPAGVDLEMKETTSTSPNGSDDVFDRIEECSDVVIKSGANGDGRVKQGSVLGRLKKFVGSETKSKGRRARRRPLGRTTAMLIIISAVYTLGFLPYLGLTFFKVGAPEKFAALTMVQLTFYNLFLRFYFLNCAANPIIYSLCDLNFRRECVSLCKCFHRR